MTDEERKFYEALSDEAKAQFDKPLDWFKWNVKCCYNCRNWQKAPYLRGDYAYNFCAKQKDMMTAWDSCCQLYEGGALDNNLIKFKEIEVKE